MTYKDIQSVLAAAETAEQGANYEEAERLTNETLAAIAAKGWEKGMESGETGRQENELRARVALILGNIARYHGNFPLALEHYAVLQHASEALDDKVWNAKTMNSFGNIYYSLGYYDKALECYRNALAIHEELNEKSNIARVTGNMGSAYWGLGSYHQALEYYGTALAVHEYLGEKSLVARITKNIGVVYANLGSYDKALEYYAKAQAAYEEQRDKSGVAQVVGNIGLVYSNLDFYDKALEYYAQALAVHEALSEKSYSARVMVNIGNVYSTLGFYDKALEYYGKALAAHEEAGEISAVAIVMLNIGNVYNKLCSYYEALEYYGKALAVHEEIGAKTSVALNLGNIGGVYANSQFEGYDPAIAEEHLLKAVAISVETGAKQHVYKFHKALAEVYENEKRWEDFATHFRKYHDIEKEVMSAEAKKQADIMEQLKQAAERENALAIVKAKHEATEQLLHNVLPPSIANKMLDGTKLIAQKLMNVSVLFADIVDFTKLSQRITPEELVEGLDRIFSEFDMLAEKHGLEKIKTIGDAYMVVSGAPEAREDHAEVMALMAMEMMEVIKQFKAITTEEEIRLRIGIHSGEVVAGVIGKKKFAYDLWGDAVNTASRMESHGESGKIHVTESFKNAAGRHFHFTGRGEVEIKGKGMMRTYFLEKQ